MTYDKIKKEINEFLDDPYELYKLGKGELKFSEKTKNEFVKYIHDNHYSKIPVRDFFRNFLRTYLVVEEKEKWLEKKR